MSENNPENMKEAMESSGYDIIPVKQGLDSLLAALCSTPKQMVIGLNSTSHNIQSQLAEYPAAAREVKVYYTLNREIELPENTFKNNVLEIVADREMIENAHLELHPVNAVPRNQGYIDYRQLEKMEKMQRVSRVKIGVPVTQTEKKLAKMWQDILKKNYVGVNDNFFESGGHSLNATVLVSRIQHEFNVGIQLGEVFQRPTIKEISEYVDNAAKAVAHSIEPAEQKEYYVLSSAQKRLFIVQQLDQSSINYNIPQVVKIKGAIELERLQEAIGRLIRRHEIFRTAFIIVDQNPYQKVYEDVDFAVEYFEAGEDEARGILENFGRPFVLTGSPPFMRVGVIKTGEDSHLLIIDMHHIISDGVSHGIFFGELMSLYAGEELLENTRCYHDFAEWQHQEKGRQVNRAQEKFWLEEFKSRVPRLNLPTDYPRPEVQDFSGKGIDIIIDEEETAALKQLQKEEGVTLFMLLLAVYNVFLHKLSGQEDIVVGIPIACRRNIELKHIIGMFVNTLPLRNYPAGGKTFRNFLREVKVRTLTAFDNQEYPFEDIVDNVLLERDPSRNPLFDVMFGVQNIDITGNRVPGIEPEPYEGHEHDTARFDFIFGGVEKDGRLVLRYDYSVKLFKPETSERYVMFLKKLISSVLSNPEAQIKSLGMVPDEEETEILSLIEEDEQDIQIDLDI
jgi:acyl carrier protein